MRVFDAEIRSERDRRETNNRKETENEDVVGVLAEK